MRYEYDCPRCHLTVTGDGPVTDPNLIMAHAYDRHDAESPLCFTPFSVLLHDVKIARKALTVRIDGFTQ